MSSSSKPSIRINLNSPRGNIFSLIGCASSISEQLGLKTPVTDEMMKATSYDDALKAFNKHLGFAVELWSSKEYSFEDQVRHCPCEHEEHEDDCEDENPPLPESDDDEEEEEDCSFCSTTDCDGECRS